MADLKVKLKLFFCSAAYSEMKQLAFAHSGDGRLLQGQPVRLAHVRVGFQHKHGDHALCRHNDHVGVGHRAVHDGGAQVDGDEVKLCH